MELYLQVGQIGFTTGLAFGLAFWTAFYLVKMFALSFFDTVRLNSKPKEHGNI
jgi:hypothetical protein